MSNLPPEREAEAARIVKTLIKLPQIAPGDSSARLVSVDAWAIADFILADRQAQRSRICREIKVRLPKNEEMAHLGHEEYPQKLVNAQRRGFNAANEAAKAVVEEVERNG